VPRSQIDTDVPAQKLRRAYYVSGCAPLVAVVKTPYLWDRNHSSKFRRMHGPLLRRVFTQREMRPRFVIILEERFYMPIQ